jgi:hypothetical protein
MNIRVASISLDMDCYQKNLKVKEDESCGGDSKLESMTYGELF